MKMVMTTNAGGGGGDRDGDCCSVRILMRVAVDDRDVVLLCFVFPLLLFVVKKLFQQFLGSMPPVDQRPKN